MVVEDIERAARSWIDPLGLTLVHVADVLDGSVRLAYLDIGDSTLQLVQPLRDGPLTEWLRTHGEGLHHICFLVGDIRQTLDALGDSGSRHVYLGGRGADVCFIGAKPCGVLVELTERTHDEWRPGGATLVVVIEPEHRAE